MQSHQGYANMVNLPASAQKVIKELLGEQKNPMQTMLAGTSKIIFNYKTYLDFDDLVKQSDADKAAGKRGMFMIQKQKHLMLWVQILEK